MDTVKLNFNGTNYTVTTNAGSVYYKSLGVLSAGNYSLLVGQPERRDFQRDGHVHLLHQQVGRGSAVVLERLGSERELLGRRLNQLERVQERERGNHRTAVERNRVEFDVGQHG